MLSTRPTGWVNERSTSLDVYEQWQTIYLTRIIKQKRWHYLQSKKFPSTHLPLDVPMIVVIKSGKCHLVKYGQILKCHSTIWINLLIQLSPSKVNNLALIFYDYLEIQSLFLSCLRSPLNFGIWTNSDFST